MKILSSFDTNLSYDLYEEYTKKYGKSNVLLFFRYKIYLILYILIPSFLYIFLISIWLYIGYIIDFSDDSLNSIKFYFFLIIFLLSFIIYGWKLLKKLMDYLMDFTIVTPDDIIHYDQTGMFTRDSVSISVRKLKTISVEKNGILRSIFNYGNMQFLSEGDSSSTGDIHIFYVKDPDNLKLQIQNVISIYNNK
ncbi:hypothetical protein [Candidatus Vampirococcus lugosii]|uniref:DUF304 domain-containing protein n=1 Tax=Candidatus Vampirococcus lugosii TaxID=2789015 RepID=A0ABS5QMA9_9BACT|nr:hypothetical protein [Candidatus Vampirococcus lugosii]MBS8121609.1 hypothetical protein [Candidatus Vampirococcus lugosii]